jgi:hypothetical protein
MALEDTSELLQLRVLLPLQADKVLTAHKEYDAAGERRDKDNHSKKENHHGVMGNLRMNKYK